MAANDESQSSFTPAGTGQMARARGDSDCIFGVAKYSRAERINVPLTRRHLAVLLWSGPDRALYSCYR